MDGPHAQDDPRGSYVYPESYVERPMNIVWMDKFFGFDSENISNPPTLLTIGGYTHERARHFRALYPSARIIAYEAMRETYDELTARPLPNAIEIVRNALAPMTGLVEMLRSPQPTSSHIARAAFAQATETVPSRTLADILLRHKLNRVDLLHMNCEGAELGALIEIATDPELRARVKQICVSFHCDHVNAYPPQLRDGIIAALAQHYAVIPGRRSTQFFLFVQCPKM